jgi:hypothetical protein
MTVTIDGTNGITTPSPVVVQGSTSGAITLAAPAVAGTNTQTLVATTGTLAPIVSGTAVASTSGTSIDFTGIPSWAKRITVMFSGVSTNGTSNLLFQLGDSGGIEATGYLGAGGTSSAGSFNSANYTTGFGLNVAAAANLVNGSLMLTLLDSATNTWAAAGNFSLSNGANNALTSGSKALSATLDRVRITTVNGTDTFDAGSINILYE